MTLKIEFTADNAEDLKKQVLSFGELLRMGAGVQQGVAAATKETKTEPEQEEVKKPVAKSKPAAAKAKPSAKKSGPSEATLRTYIGDLAAFFLADPEEAPKLADLLDKYNAEDLDSVSADDVAAFAEELRAVATEIWDESDVEALPTK